jgi:flagellar biosynthesis/type III secretory pathway protein FliH
MSDKYAQEMILIPKPSRGQRGGHVTPDSMDQFWQRRLLVDQLTNAPHVDRMMKLLNDMKQVEGQALPPTVPGEGPDSSDYFQLQRQLKSIPPHPVKTVFTPKKAASPATPSSQKTSTRPPPASSFKEALEQQAEIEKTLEQFKQKAKQEMEQALKEGNEDAIKEADYKWKIVTRSIEDIRQEDNFLNSADLPDWLQQLIYGQEEEKKARSRAREDSNRRRDKLYRQLERMYPNQRGQGSKSLVWQKPRGWIQE